MIVYVEEKREKELVRKQVEGKGHSGTNVVRDSKAYVWVEGSTALSVHPRLLPAGGTQYITAYLQG